MNQWGVPNMFVREMMEQDFGDLTESQMDTVYELFNQWKKGWVKGWDEARAMVYAYKAREIMRYKGLGENEAMVVLGVPRNLWKMVRRLIHEQMIIE